ncbi:MAG TPA: outer membrane beta-barrel protein, partial [Acidisoma sp.]|nr:outer membrane beta-barrel protein [Acidisoma sp.]
MRHRRLSSAVLLFPLVAGLGPAACPARAQLIENVYPEDVPGFDAARGVSVTSRIQTDTAWQNIPLGAELLHPEVTEGVSYDSAVLAGQRPSWVFSTAPSLTLISNDQGSSVAAVASADSEHYVAAPEQSYTDWTGAVGGTFDLADCKVTAAIAHLALHENDNGLDAADYDTPLPFSVDTMRLRAVTPLTRLTLEPSFDLTRFTFGSTTIGGLPAPQSYRDRLVGEVALTLSYGATGFQDPNQFELILRGAGARYPNEILGEPAR